MADSVTLSVQVNGKMRARIDAPADADEAQLQSIALADENVARFVDGKPLRRFIVVPGKLVNIVV